MRSSKLEGWHSQIHTYIYVCVCIYIYIYIYRQGSLAVLQSMESQRVRHDWATELIYIYIFTYKIDSHLGSTVSTGNSTQHWPISWTGKESIKEQLSVYIKMYHLAVHLKQTKHCKSITLQYKAQICKQKGKQERNTYCIPLRPQCPVLAHLQKAWAGLGFKPGVSWGTGSSGERATNERHLPCPGSTSSPLEETTISG